MSGLSELGGALHEEHFRIVVWISDLQNRVTGAAGERSLDPDNAEEKQALHQLISSLDQLFHHHAFEEEVLFPLICECGEGDLAGFLTDDHSTIEPITEHLRSIATQILEYGADQERWYTFRRIARQFFLEMMSHLAIEEMSIIQRLHSLLDNETDRGLARQHSTERLLRACGTASWQIH